MQQLSAEKLNAFFGQLHQPFLAEMLPSFFEKLGFYHPLLVLYLIYYL